MLYQLQALGMEALQPLNQLSKTSRFFWSHPFNVLSGSWAAQFMAAGLELFERLTTVYERPAWGYETVLVDGRDVPIREEIVHRLPWCDLLRFRKDCHRNGDTQPRILVVAPMSGHYPTLLRGHIEYFLPQHDVYVTDWCNARDVCVSEGAFHLDDYTEYLIEFLRFLGPNTHIVAVCQPGVPALMATALMGMTRDIAAPASLTLIAAPIDTRSNPTEVNDYASRRDYEWYEKNVIFDVPFGFKGQGQRVYPGFIQLTGFLSLNFDNHIRRHYKFYEDLLKDDGDSAEAHRKFYNEYLAVMDMSAPFYLETIKRVFIEHHLPRRMAHYRNVAIDLDAVRDTAILTIEGGKDDITGAGQTHAAHDLCRKLPAEKRKQHTEPLVGHYGAFNGGYFRQNIGPLISAFMHKHERPGKLNRRLNDA
jgi:poly(3-hydroxybutyrate) depolymerase